MSLRLLRELHDAFGDARFTVASYWQQRRVPIGKDSKEPSRAVVDQFVDECVDYVRAGLLVRTDGECHGEGWRLTPAGITAVDVRRGYEERKLARGAERFERERRRQDHLRISVAIDLLRSHGYVVTAPEPRA